jgi:hypothetical protein
MALYEVIASVQLEPDVPAGEVLRYITELSATIQLEPAVTALGGNVHDVGATIQLEPALETVSPHLEGAVDYGAILQLQGSIELVEQSVFEELDAIMRLTPSLSVLQGNVVDIVATMRLSPSYTKPTTRLANGQFTRTWRNLVDNSITGRGWG